MSIWSKYRERRQRMREVRQAIRNGTLGEYHHEKHGSHTAPVVWNRTEELRPDRLGPSEDDIPADRDPWRPARTLGKWPHS